MKVPYQSGLYAFFMDDLCLYVGKADCLSKRVAKQQRRFREATELRYWELQSELEGLSYMEGRVYLAYREMLMIMHLQPLVNLQRKASSFWRLPFNVQRKLMELIPSLNL